MPNTVINMLCKYKADLTNLIDAIAENILEPNLISLR